MKQVFLSLLCIFFIGNAFAQRMKTQTMTKTTTVPLQTVTMASTIVPKAIGEPIEVKNVTAKQYQKKFDELVAKGYRPIKIKVDRQQVIDYQDGEVPQIGYWATFQKFENGYAWEARHNLSAQAYQQEFEAWTAKGYIPASIGVGCVGNAETYAVIFEKVPNAPAWVARHGLSLNDFSKQHQDFLKQGYKLKQKVSCNRNGTVIYAAVWSK